MRGIKHFYDSNGNYTGQSFDFDEFAKGLGDDLKEGNGIVALLIIIGIIATVITAIVSYKVTGDYGTTITNCIIAVVLTAVIPFALEFSWLHITLPIIGLIFYGIFKAIWWVLKHIYGAVCTIAGINPKHK